MAKILSFSHTFLSMMLIFCLQHVEANNQNLVTASFVFGDSLVDAGNNNYITTLSRANRKPNGCDFKPSHGRPTGRFTNGRIIADIIIDELGMKKYPPPFYAPTTNGSAILHGVNYASGASGILSSTGSFFVGRIPLGVQIGNFAKTKKQLIKIMGQNKTNEFLAKSIFSVVIGSNDFINNYLTPFVSTIERTFISPHSFILQTIKTYKTQLKKMYKLGARKIVVANIGPLGCIPYQRSINRIRENQCAALPNELARKFNNKLKPMLEDLNQECHGAVFVYANIYSIVERIIKNYAKYGFESASTACCGSGGRYRGIIPCGPSTYECPDHSKYVFWDPYHPSEAANIIVASYLINGSSNFISPMNVKMLINMP